jgi:hypothetical protein
MEIDSKNKCIDTLLGDVAIKIGGKTGKFVPNINASKWDDECWLNINHPDIVSDQVASLEDGMASLIIKDQTHRYYIDSNGELEYEIELAKKPQSNIINLSLTFPDGLEFFYQPPLTEKQIAGGRHRSDNVIGSYAVYWNKSNNQYKTGKFCHIYRPKVTDADGKWTWAELSIVGRTLSITIDQTWLDNAVYPIIVDPTLGYNTVGASHVGNTAYAIGSNAQTDATGGTINSFHIAVYSIGTPATVKMVVYNTDQALSSHLPTGKTIVEQVSFTATVSNDSNAASSGTKTLSASTWYSILFLPANSDTDIKYDTGSGANPGKYDCTYANEFTDPAGTYQEDTDRYSVWIIYSASSETDINVSAVLEQANAFQKTPVVSAIQSLFTQRKHVKMIF